MRGGASLGEPLEYINSRLAAGVLGLIGDKGIQDKTPVKGMLSKVG